MNNEHVVGQLNDYLDGLLPPEGRTTVESHLARCPGCANELEQLKSFLSRVRELPKSVQPPADLWRNIESRLGEPEHTRQTTHTGLRERSLSHTGLASWIRYGSALAAIILISVVGWLWYNLQTVRAWNVAALEGTVRIGSSLTTSTGRIGIGQILETDETSRAKIEVGTIGHVDVDPNTRIRLVEATMTDHRLALEEGTIHATIFAPPRIFFVETPSALAVDLGCAYTLRVDSTGASVIEVTSGWVSLEFAGKESIVPAGAVCATRPGYGPGTPFLEDASERLKTALRNYDFSNGSRGALDAVLEETRNIDSITLWHLLFRTVGEDRVRTYDRLAALVPAPKGVTREGMLGGDPEMVKKWQKQLNLGQKPWWKVWM